MTIDDLDAMLEGSDPTPASQAQNEGQGDEPGQDGSSTGKQNPEEVEFSKLSGSAQERFKKLVQDKRSLMERLNTLETRTTPPPAPGNVQTPDVQDAVKKLNAVGIATKDDIKSEINDSLAKLRYEAELNRLEDKYTGDSSEPKFVREEYEDYVSSHPQYQNYFPEDVFKKMYEEELLNLELQRRQSGTGVTRSSSLRPTRTQVQRETLTPEYIEGRLKEPDGQQWYADNKEKIDAAVSQMGK